MKFVGLVRIGQDPAEVQRQRAALTPLCAIVFEEQAYRKRLVKNRPALLAALEHLEQGDVLVVQRGRDLAQDTVSGCDTIRALYLLGITVKVLEGAAKGLHDGVPPHGNFILETAELQAESLSTRIKSGLQQARDNGDPLGRPRLLDDEKRAAIFARRENGEPIRVIAKQVGLSVGTVHNALKEQRFHKVALLPEFDDTLHSRTMPGISCPVLAAVEFTPPGFISR